MIAILNKLLIVALIFLIFGIYFGLISIFKSKRSQKIKAVLIVGLIFLLISLSYFLNGTLLRIIALAPAIILGPWYLFRK